LEDPGSEMTAGAKEAGYRPPIPAGPAEGGVPVPPWDDPNQAGTASKPRAETKSPDPDALLALLAAQQKASKGPAFKMASTLIVMIVVAIILVVGSIVGAIYLKHLALNNNSGGGGGGGSAGSVTAEESVQSALAAARQFAAKNGEPALASSPLSLDQYLPATTGVAVSTASNADTEVGVAALSPSALVIVSLGGSSCYGVLDVFQVQKQAPFSAYSATLEPGLYYFTARTTSPSICLASSVAPPGGSQYLSVTGFPTSVP
jgi:hypothetical protein